jgi:PIN domain nuclease of toxin-antitoxin system
VEPGRQHLTYLDTHAAIWLCTGEQPIPQISLLELETADLRLSPMVLMEMKLLHEVSRVNWGPAEWLAVLATDFGVSVCPIPFHRVVEAAYAETWTRDPFDRLIVAQARVAGAKLLTKDRRIHTHFDGAIW